MMTVEELVKKAHDDGASDIHIICGLPPKYRLSGRLENMSSEELGFEDCVDAARWLAGGSYDEFEKEGELDLAGTYAGSRCRVHIFKQQGIPSMVYYAKPMHQQGAFEGTRSASADCKVTEKLCTRVLSLPMHPYLTEETVGRIAEELIKAIK